MMSSKHDTLIEKQKQDIYLRERKKCRFQILPDGNCLYRAFSQALYGHQNMYHDLRHRAVSHMRGNLDLFRFLIEGDAETFLSKAAQDKTWAGYPEMMALGDSLDVNIHLTLGGSLANPTISTSLHSLGEDYSGRKSIWLSWLSCGHYDTVLDYSPPRADYDIPYRKKESRSKKKKRHAPPARHFAQKELSSPKPKQ